MKINGSEGMSKRKKIEREREMMKKKIDKKEKIKAYGRETANVVRRK